MPAFLSGHSSRPLSVSKQELPGSQQNTVLIIRTELVTGTGLDSGTEKYSLFLNVIFNLK